MSYVSVEEFQKYTNVYSEEPLQQSYIDSAENIVNAYLGYSPTLHAYWSYFDGNGTNELQLNAKPITEIIMVIINGSSVAQKHFASISNSEFIQRENGVFPIGKRNISVSFAAGYGIAVDEDAVNGPFVPSIIRMTVSRIAALLQSESDSNIGITSKSFADSGTRSFINTVNFDKYLIQIANYKLLVI